MKTINERYEVIESLSRDSGSVEYLVADRKNDHRVMRLRIFDTDLSNQDRLRELEEKFISLKNIAHENLLAAYTFRPIFSINGSSVNRTQYFYTYEHYDDNQVMSYMTFNKSQVMSVIVQLCKITRFLHFKGIVYKFLNFDHILFIKQDDKIIVKLKDLAHNHINDYYFKLDHERFSQFVAPEIIWGDDVEPSCDLYSLGMIFYYVYYQVSYKQKSIYNVIKSNQANQIYQFISKSVHQIKEERYQSIDAFVSDLSKLIWIDVDNDDADAYNVIHQKVSIVGREGIVKDIRSLMHEKYKKNLTYHGVFIRGELGVGKTRLLKEIQHVARFHRYFTVFSTPKFNASEPFYTVRRILLHIADQADVSPLLIQKYAYDLCAIVPELAERWGIKTLPDFDAKDQSLRVMNRAFNFFVEYSTDRMIIVLIDDEEYIQEYERYFFDMLFQYKGPSNYFLVFTGTEVKKKEHKHELLRIMKLPALNLEETGELVKIALGIHYIPYSLTHRLMIESLGNPRKTLNMLKMLWLEKHIYFNKTTLKWHFEKINDAFSFDDYDGQKENYDDIIQALSPEDINLLMRLSLIKGSFNMQLVFEYGGIDEENGYYFLAQMEELRIFNKRISDVEYVFVFSNNELRKVFYDKVPQEWHKHLYADIAAFYEKRFMTHSEVNEHLIDYFIFCGEEERAAQTCIAFAEFYLEHNNNLKAVGLYEKAIDIYEQRGCVEEMIRHAIPLIHLMIKIGMLDQAFSKLPHLLELTRDTYKTAHIDTLLLKAWLFYFKNELDSAFDLAVECEEKAHGLDYQIGVLDSIFYQCKCYIALNEVAKHYELVKKGLELCKSVDSPSHYAKFQNELGINLLYSNKFEESLSAFNESLTAYKHLEDEEHMIKAYNNLGVVQIEGDGDYFIAREFFRKAYTLANNKNYLVLVPTELSNLGETYLIEARYEMAIRYFEQAHQIADRIGDRNLTLLSLLNLCSSLILSEQYSKAYTLMNRLEHEFAAIQKKTYNQIDFQFNHFEFYLAMNNMMSLDKWRNQFQDADLFDHYRLFKLRVLDLTISYKKNKLLKHQFVIDTPLLKELAYITVKPSEVKLVRTLVLDLLLDHIEAHDYLYIDDLLEIDSHLAMVYNTKLYRMKRDVIDACLSDYVIDRLLLLIDGIKGLSQELLWRVYKILGTEYYQKNHLYDALMYDLMAINVIWDLTQGIPQEYKETYILYDASKMSLKQQIQKIIRSFLKHMEIGPISIDDDRYDTIDDYFDLSLLEDLYRDKAFMNLVHDKYHIQTFEKFDSATSLIKNFEKDEIKNLVMILKYLQQMTLSERASLYLLDESDNVSEAIHASEGYEPYDISKLINNFSNDMEGTYISKLNQNANAHVLTEAQKGLICFPVFEALSTSQREEKRREDLLNVRKKIVAYVFLDTDNVIHRFNEETFQHAKSFINLLYVFIDNYNLKRVSTIDKLTGVYLRKYIEQQFATQMNLSRQHNYHLSVIMLDIDKFKNVNDTYGHRKGDDILTEIGSLLNDSVRSTDYVGRYGGEEFIILLPETDAQSAYKVAEKIRKHVENRKMLGEDMSLTVSLGVSTYPKDGANEEELIERADQALYYSKNNGRNKVTSWDEKLIHMGHRYDRLTGILTGNISSDTRNVQAIIDILNQLEHSISRETCIKNTFISLLDITEGESIEFLKYDKSNQRVECLYKKKGLNRLEKVSHLNERLIHQYLGTNQGSYFIDWQEQAVYEQGVKTPDWKSYIVIAIVHDTYNGILAISVPIKDKEFDFSNYNFVEALVPVLKHLLFD